MKSCELKLGQTTLKGTEDEALGVQKFFGIPFAQPPIGRLRFKNPVALPEDYNYGTEVRDCSKFASICPQPIFHLNDNPISQPRGSEFSEDCLYVNIWVPSSEPPAGGWPVLAWIHGGFLQTGNPLQGPENDPAELISKSGAGLQCIVAAIGYRLNVFGFLACAQLKGNFGLWDQRMGLQWINKNIHSFGGNAHNVTIAGLSAGANSVHHQINFDFFESNTEPLFQRAVMYSNAISEQPRKCVDADEQFHELCQAFDIPTDSSFQQKLDRLRSIESADLAAKLLSLTRHSFRPVTDHAFVSSDQIRRAQDGTLALEFKKRDFKLIIGEVENEETVYRGVNPARSRAELLPQLQNYYSKETAKSLLALRPFPKEADETDPEAWKDLFGLILAASQVRSSSRCLVAQLLDSKHGFTTQDVLRYRVSYRLKVLSRFGLPESMGVGHGMDQLIWWYCARLGYDSDEVVKIKAWLEPFKEFVHCAKTVDWGTSGMKQYRRLNPDGSISVEEDEYWEGLEDLGKVLMPSSIKR